jgi:hypothetical protein
MHASTKIQPDDDHAENGNAIDGDCDCGITTISRGRGVGAHATHVSAHEIARVDDGKNQIGILNDDGAIRLRGDDCASLFPARAS